MEIVEKIVAWAASQPLWYQIIIADVLKGKEFLDEEIATYADIALQEVVDPEGLIGKYGNPLERFNYSDSSAATSVSLLSLSETVNVNDIADGSVLEFDEQGINIIYGNNAAGKSGYTRVLKSSCMSRHDERVQGSIYRSDAPESSARISYKQQSIEESYDWSNNSEANPHLKSVNVFDSKSGSAYLSKHTDIKYKPAGMDVLDKLVDVVQRVQARLNTEKTSKQLQLTNLTPIFAAYADTKAHALINVLERRGAVEELNRLSVLSDEEQQALGKLEKEIPERERLAPAKYRDNLTKITGRLERILAAADLLSASLSKSRQEQIVASLKLRDEAIKIAEQAKKTKFDSDDYLKGTGNDLWKVMWKAAESFSLNSAYVGHTFPHTDGDAKCPLCQQSLPEATGRHLKEFAKYVADKSQENARIRKNEYDVLIEKFTQARPPDNMIEALFNEVGTDDYSATEEVKDAVLRLSAYHDRYIEAIKKGKPIIETLDLSAEASLIKALKNHTDQSRIELDKPLDDKKYVEDLANDKLKLKGLKARKLLADNDEVIRANINTHISLAAYSAALGKCNTAPISLQSGRLSADHIVAPLESSFNEELGKIFSSRIKAKLVPAPTRHGVPHSEIILTADGSRSREKIESIMSEGEQRGLALAGFFTELSMMPHKSAIIFDDPITSMDDENASKIARRLIEASKERQVVVFTHRVTFVSQLLDEAKKMGITNVPTKTVSKLSHPGVVEERMPWDAMKVKDRLGWLNNNLQSVLTPLYRDDNAEAYQDKAEHFYKKLRETWERAVEERLFGDVVKRHSRNVSTQQMRDVKYRESDNIVVDESMSKCSTYVHDGTGESVEPIPTIEVVTEDLKKLTDWLDELKQR